MTAVTIKMSQAVVDQQHALDLQSSGYASSLAGLFGTIGSVQGDLDPGQPVSSTLNGTTLTVRYTSGATETYKNVMLDAGGLAGHGSATDYELDQYGVAAVFGTGKINFDYKVDGGNVWLYTSAQGDTFTTMGGVAVTAKKLQRFPLAASATDDPDADRASARALRALDPSRLAPGHGKVVEGPAAAMDRAIAKA